ncbi:hypothetical protein MJM04_31395, partial [Salmonella enterica subsp. enterica serovar Cerro]|nr:hypothetical protein [Salmonella enterica subsp. enterica serovar Cerro]
MHNSMKLYRQIRERNPNAKLVMHMHNAFEPELPDNDAKIIVPVCARFPWPLLTGDALRAYNQIKVLSEKNVVDVFSVEKPFASQ